MLPSRRERRDKFLIAITFPDLLEDICESMSEGMTLYDFAKKRDLPYGKLHDWIHKDHVRLAQYAVAIEKRNAAIQDRVTSGLLAIAEADMAQMFNADGSVKELSNMPEEARKALAGFERSVDPEGRVTTKVRLNPRDRGLELAGKAVGMFRDRLEVTMNVGFADRLKAARVRTGMKEVSEEAEAITISTAIENHG
jgi:hypothetical protein